MEINMAGGFLIAVIGNLTKKADSIDVNIVEEKMKLLENKGIITYEFNKSYVSFIYDLILFENIGWIYTNNNKCKLTEKGMKLFNEIEIPNSVKEKFYNIFEEV